MTRFKIFNCQKCSPVVLILALLLVTLLAAAVPARPAAASGYTLPPVTQLTAAAYGNGAYVAAGTAYTGAGASATGSFVVLTATDGGNWTVTQPLPNLNIANICQIAFGNGIFVAVGSMPGKTQTGGLVLTSSDGTNWAPNSFDVGFSKVVFGNGRFVLLGYNNNYTSTDGISWTPVPGSKAISENYQLIYNNGVFAAFDDITGTQFATSPDGVNWQTRDDGLIDYSGTGMIYPNIGVTGAVYGNGMYVVVATYYPNTQAGGSPYPIVITSQDAVKWTMTKVDHQLTGVTAGNGVFVAINPQGGTLAFADIPQGGIVTSSDGDTWTTRDTGTKTSYEAVFFCNDRFVALGSDGTISTSPDGVNWSNQQPTTPTAPLTIPKSTVIVARFLIGQDFWYPGPGNGTKGLMDTAPYVDRNSGRVLVPVRYLAAALGERTDWDAATQTVSVIGNSELDASITTVTMVIGSTVLDVNGRKQTMDQAPLIRDGRTYLPARYVAEAFGYNVSWNATSQTVTVSLEE